MANERKRAKRPAALNGFIEAQALARPNFRSYSADHTNRMPEEQPVETVYLGLEYSNFERDLSSQAEESYSLNLETGEVLVLPKQPQPDMIDRSISNSASAPTERPPIARKRTSKPRIYMAPAEAASTHDAIEYANSCGWLMNVSVTFAPIYIGVESESGFTEVINRFFKRYALICRNWRIDNVYVAVIERARDRGFHAHMALSIPITHRDAFEYWLKHTGKTLSNNESYSTKVFDYEFRDSNVIRQWIYWRYMVKSIDPDVTYKTYILERRVRVGTVKDLMGVKHWYTGRPFSSQRVRVSRSISPARRKAARFFSAWKRTVKLPEHWGAGTQWADSLENRDVTRVELFGGQERLALFDNLDASPRAGSFYEYRGSLDDLDRETYGGLGRAIDNSE